MAALLLLAFSARGQEADNHQMMINARVGGIINSAYSNITAKREFPDENSVIERTPAEGARPVRFGFELGADMYLLRSDKFKFVMGLTFSRTTAEYHYAYLSEDVATRPGYTHVRHSTELNISEVYNAINVMAGIRNRIIKPVYLSSLLVLSKPVRTRTISNGYNQTTFENKNTSETQSAFLYYNNEEAIKKGGEVNISFRFSVEYQFTFVDVPARVYAYRNFGLIYTLPWWGLGVSLTLN